MERALKRILDLVGAAVLGLLTLPLMAAIALWVRCDSPGPALFRQRRIGRGGKPFTLYKFRTMRVGAEAEWTPPTDAGQLAGYYFQDAADPRITRVGAWLRRTSLDELPNLWNVIKGEMSLVGPRPEVPEIVALYDDAMAERLTVLPGITGLAQVRGRGELSTLESIAWDLEYCRHWSLGLDLKILWETLCAVGRGRGAR